MKTNIKLLGLLLAVAGMSSCQDDFDSPVVEEPVATIKPNLTIYELKQMYWDDAVNYIDTIGIENGQDDGLEYVISGRVVSSDEAGNVFKSLVIQDETAALALSINSYNLYLNYRIGQEIVLDLKGMYIGKYNGLVQLGMPEWYESGNVWEASFMAPEFFRKHAQLNGFPQPEKVDTVEVNAFSDLPTDPEGLCKWQSQLVKFNNVSFQNGGEALFSSYHSSGQNENIVDAYGNTLPVRTSGYSNFWNNTLPKGSGDVVCILSYYGTTGWQLILNDFEGCMNFGNPTVAPGAYDKPYDVSAVIQGLKEGQTRIGWVEGYIVGAVAPEVTEVKNNDDIEWGANVVLDNTLVIGQTADTKDIENALVISLLPGSALRQYGNLVQNPDNYQKQIKVKGTFGEYMGTYGVLKNTGTPSEFWIEGVEIDTDGKGTLESPYSIAKAIEVAQANGTTSDVFYYIQGYVGSGSIDTSYGNGTFDLYDSPSATGSKLIAYRIKDIDNKKFTDANKVKVGDQIVVYAPLINYMGNTPETGTGGYLISVTDNGGGGTEDPNGAGTEANPYSVSDVRAGATGSNVWVDCYIVGWIDGQVYSTGANFNSNATVKTNLLVAASADVTDPDQCIPVQLPSGNIRNEINLQEHPEYYKKQIMLKGNLETYFGQPGLKGVSAYKMDGQSGGDEPENPGEASGEGTVESPYNVVKAIQVAQANGETSDVSVYTEGYVMSGSIDTGYGSGTWIICDNADGSTPKMTVYAAKDLGNQPFTNADKVKVGDKIVVYAPLVNYKGNTPETSFGYLYSINGETQNVEPDTPAEIEGDGTEDKPFTVSDVRNGATGTNVWVDGYIVGWVDGQVYSTGVTFNSSATVKTNLVLAASADIDNPEKCIPVQLPSGSVRNDINLQDHPQYYKQQVKLKGNLEAYFGQPGLKGVTEYKIEGVGGDEPDTPVEPGDESGDGTENSPYNVAKAVEVAIANGTSSDVSVYTAGYVLSGSIDTGYGNGTWVICDAADGSGATIDVFRAKDFNNEKFTEADKVKVGDYIVVYAPLINYNGTKPETSYGYLYSINGETSGNGSSTGGSGDDPVNPPVVGTNSADFDTFNGGEPNTTNYGTYTTADGWVGNWILVGAGGTEATNFISTDASTLFPIIDGTPARPGTLTSPTLTGGISTLSFNYGFPYNETKVGFTVNIKQNGAVVASDTVVVDSATKAKVFAYSHDFNVSGDFVIEIVNDCITQSSSNNKDRLAVWNLVWDN